MTISRNSLFSNIKINAVLFLSFLLIACQTAHNSTPPDFVEPHARSAEQGAAAPASAKTAGPQRSEKYQKDRSRLEQCQAQLEVLKGMNNAQYKTMRNTFDYLMNGAAQYENIRQKVSADTQDTVDALYLYRANLLCSQIEQALLNRLTIRGEARP